MKRVYNFSPGPAMLPEAVLKKAQKELLNYNGCGMSVMELSHRSDIFKNIIEKCESLLREVMFIPHNYKVIFLQGGASTQFSMVPLNLLKENGKADFVNTGAWSKKAIEEAKRYGEISVVASSEDDNFTYIPEIKMKNCNSNADYFHITHNNTIYGTRYTFIPATGGIPLVSDMSSSILSEVIDVSKYGLIYAGAQKNMGPAGVTIVIIREDLIGYAKQMTPTMLNYKTYAHKKSLYNTPPCYNIYMTGLILEWISKMGGIKTIYEINKQKASLIYKYLDNSSLFKGTAKEKDRSLMNITFVLTKEELTEKFLKKSQNMGFLNLKGHRSVGGVRASIYNYMPLKGVEKLVEFMKIFEKENS